MAATADALSATRPRCIRLLGIDFYNLRRARLGPTWCEANALSNLDETPHAHETDTPHASVHDSSGCRTMRSVPVCKAFGGQVIGSMARPRRRRSAVRVSPVNAWM